MHAVGWDGRDACCGLLDVLPWNEDSTHVTAVLLFWVMKKFQKNDNGIQVK